MNGHLTVAAGELAAAVKYVARWLPTRPTVPIHAGILAEVDGDRMHLFGFNENTTGRATVAIDAADEPSGSFVVSGRLLDAICATLSDKPVRIEAEGSDITIRSGRTRVSLPTMSANDYPRLPGLADPIGTINGSALAAAVRQVGVAAGRDIEKGEQWTGIHVDFATDDAVTLVATDSFRMARTSVQWIGEAVAAPVLIPAAVMVDAVAAFDGRPDVVIGSDEGMFSMSTELRSMTTRMLDAGRFPAASLMPIFDADRDTEVTFRVRDAALPLKRIGLLKNKETDRIDLTVRSGALEFAGNAGEALGNGDDEIDADYEGEDLSIALRSSVLHDALASAPGESVTLSFNAGTFKPMLIVTESDPDWRHVIVPLRPVN
jgi:DNA polymerase III subunit beta